MPFCHQTQYPHYHFHRSDFNHGEAEFINISPGENVKNYHLHDYINAYFWSPEWVYNIIKRDDICTFIKTEYREGSYEVDYDFYIQILDFDYTLVEGEEYYFLPYSTIQRLIKTGHLNLITPEYKRKSLYHSSNYQNFIKNDFYKCYTFYGERDYDDDGDILCCINHNYHVTFSWMKMLEEKSLKELIEWLGEDRVLEIGSGRALLARLLTDYGMTSKWIATDSYGWCYINTFYPVEHCNHREALEKYSDCNTLVLIWPIRGPMSYEVIKTFTGNRLLFSSELHPSYFEYPSQTNPQMNDDDLSWSDEYTVETANNDFYEELNKNWKMERSFDNLLVFIRRPE